MFNNNLFITRYALICLFAIQISSCSGINIFNSRFLNLSPKDQVKEIISEQKPEIISSDKIKVEFVEKYALAEYGSSDRKYKEQVLLTRSNGSWSILHKDPGAILPSTLISHGVDSKIAIELYDKFYSDPKEQAKLAALANLYKSDSVETWPDIKSVKVFDKYSLVSYTPYDENEEFSQILLVKDDDYGWQRKFNTGGYMGLDTLIRNGVPQNIAEQLSEST